MSQHTGSHKNSSNLLGEKYLNESHWPMRRIRLLECRQKRKEFNEREAEKSNATDDVGDYAEDDDDTGETFRKEMTIFEDIPSRVMKASNNLRSFLQAALAEK